MRFFDTLARTGASPQHWPGGDAKGDRAKKGATLQKPRRHQPVPAEMYSASVPRATLYRHLKAAGATRLKLGVLKQKVRKRWSREHTHDLWLGDFEEGPYVLSGNELQPTHLSAFIDCHSRYIVEARYYLRQNLDILIDTLIRPFPSTAPPVSFI